MAVERPAYDNGMRYAKCGHCGMGWLEYERPVELLPGSWTTSGERDHECPEPLPYQTARMMCDALVASGMPTSQRTKARIKLGLASDPRAEGA